MPIPVAAEVAVTVVMAIKQFETDYKQDKTVEKLQQLVTYIRTEVNRVYDELKRAIAQSYIDQDINDIASKLTNSATKLGCAATAPCYDDAPYYHDIRLIADDGFGYIPRLLRDIARHEADLANREGALVTAIVYARTLLAVMCTASEREDVCSGTPDFHKPYRDGQIEAFHGHVHYALGLLRDWADAQFKGPDTRPGESNPGGRSVNVGYYGGSEFVTFTEVQPGHNSLAMIREAKRAVGSLLEELKQHYLGISEIRQIASA
jgi:hypothetical protein